MINHLSFSAMFKFANCFQLPVKLHFHMVFLWFPMVSYGFSPWNPMVFLLTRKGGHGGCRSLWSRWASSDRGNPASDGWWHQGIIHIIHLSWSIIHNYPYLDISSIYQNHNLSYQTQKKPWSQPCSNTIIPRRPRRLRRRAWSFRGKRGKPSEEARHPKAKWSGSSGYSRDSVKFGRLNQFSMLGSSGELFGDFLFPIFPWTNPLNNA